MTLDKLHPEDSAMLILPGGHFWDDGKNREAALLARKFLAAGVPVAAICGATAGLARVGMLDLMQPVLLDLTELARNAIDDALAGLRAPNCAEVRLQALPQASGVGVLLRQVFVNLIGNALKYSGHAEHPLVEIGVVVEEDGDRAIFIRDNGIGFDAAHARTRRATRARPGGRAGCPLPRAR